MPLNSFLKNMKIIRTFFWTISLLGTPYFYIPVILYFLKASPRLAIILAFALLFTEIVCAAVKYIYPKERPIPMPNKTFFQKYRAGSFPSIHTARITTFSISIISVYTNKIFILTALLVISGVGYSRIYLKKHYFIDVICGFIIGAVIGISVLSLPYYGALDYLKLLNLP